MTAELFRHQHPNCFYLDPEDQLGLISYLQERGLVDRDEAVVTTAKAGEGNMNCVVRVVTARRSLVLKQSRPWVEKYPQFAAPWDRALRELDFYRLVGEVPGVAMILPRLLWGDPAARLLVLEDLGQGGDYTDLYRGEILSFSDLAIVASFLTALHAAFAQAAPRPVLPNREMRALNHTHIFVLPLAPNNGLDLEKLQPGLQFAADALKHDREYCAAVARLGREVYLSDGPCLLHGDLYPGSLVRTPAGPRVIDPEFCYFGRPEYDVAVWLAHLLLADQSAALREHWWARYTYRGPFDNELMIRLVGVEMMRRLIGYAQLPLALSLPAKRNLLDLSRELVLCPQRQLLATSIH